MHVRLVHALEQSRALHQYTLHGSLFALFASGRGDSPPGTRAIVDGQGHFGGVLSCRRKQGQRPESAQYAIAQSMLFLWVFDGEGDAPLSHLIRSLSWKIVNGGGALSRDS